MEFIKTPVERFPQKGAFSGETTAMIPHLFRSEFSRLTAVLCRHFGFHRLEEIEDIISETFLAALESWPYKGLPANPVAWLYVVAENKTRNRLKREKILVSRVLPAIKNDIAEPPETVIDLSGKNITDSQLQMFFAVSHPAIPVESQIALALRVLCGFGIGEIATALLIGEAAASKRLVRAKEILRSETFSLQMPEGDAFKKRLPTVLTTIYLLFNEGYYSESRDRVVREELCLEAMRLTHQLLESENSNVPETNALMALMCFHSSRLPARVAGDGELILYDQQDESLWNRELIARGSFYLRAAASGDKLSRYHLEAAIAWWHTVRENPEEKWKQILLLYDHLLQFAYSPVAALNRTFALAKVHGAAAGIGEAGRLQLTQNPYYHILLGELYRLTDRGKAAAQYRVAMELLKNESEKRLMNKKIAEL